ncbi:MAG TPA: PQQ-dependent dehydrogenase, methanol/ethanol family, partial [Rhizomicrobium sp.]|nr:PQQ-dependent dehydrogenase, methanol/ethanol family [Rhizomicrobium sp.]
MRKILLAAALVSGAALPAIGADAPSNKSFTGATANLAPGDAPGQWTRQARDYANTRYSPLTQINTKNVARLRMAWTFSDGQMYGHEGAPLVVGDTMYLVTPFPNIAYALDLSKPGAPIKWVFQPNPDPRAIGEACCDKVLRGWAYADGKLIYNLLDDHTVAVDAQTGKEVWRVLLDDVSKGPTLTQAAFVVGDKVYIGSSGGELGTNGWFQALDVKDGHTVWKAFTNGPDAGTLIGPDFEPFYPWMKGKDLGVSTWPGEMWKQGASAPWGWVSYDPDLNLIYYGTSNPGPRVPSQRPGLNLWSSAVFARDANTGAAKWAYQLTPHDEWDYDGINENVLIEIPWNGARRKVAVHFDRNGFAYTIDRTNGEVLVAEPFGHQNWAKKIDLATGMPVVNDAAHPIVEKKVENICPPDIGVKNWNPSAFSPRTGLLYAGVFNSCMDLTNHIVQYIPGSPYDGMEMVRKAGPGGNWGEFIAWDPVAGKRVWSIKENLYVWSGAVVTGSDLVFYGT